MINITFVDPDTGLDVVWPLKVREHSPAIEKRNTATAEAGDYEDPDFIYKGSYETAQLDTYAIDASEFATFTLFKRATVKGRSFVIEGSVVPLFGYDYNAHRIGDLKPKSLHGGRYFSFEMTVRVLGAVA